MHALPSTLPAPLAHSIASVLDAPAAPPPPEQSLTAHLISLFPTPSDLDNASLDKAQAKLRADAQQADARVERLVRQLDEEQQQAAAQTATDATLDGTAAEQAVATLLAQLASIREKARESEVVVRDITREIRNLDTAKRNVVASMTALKRLQMLGTSLLSIVLQVSTYTTSPVNAVSQLSRLTHAGRYAEAASALAAVEALRGSFGGYAGVERLALVGREVETLRKELEQRARSEFEQL